MAKQQFDLVILSIGYNEYVLSKAAAVHFMDLCVGADIYRWDGYWDGKEHQHHAIPLENGMMPRIRLISSTQFLEAVELRKMYDEAERAKKQAKENE
jgi:hypothetical protein